jgi:hypothetical protein
MIAQPGQITSYQNAVHSLRRLHPPRLISVLEQLEYFNRQMAPAAILEELDPDKYQRILTQTGSHEIDGEDAILVAAIDAIDNVAPLNLEYIEMNLFEAGEDELEFLYPDPHGYQISFDQWYESCEDLDNSWLPDAGLFIFITAIRFEDRQILQKAKEWLGWTIRSFPDLGNYGDPDWNRFYQLLDQNNLSCFKNAFDACLYSTGNPYFDFNLADDGYGIPNLPPFTLNGMRELRKFWEDAQPIIQDFNCARLQFLQDTSLAGKILKLYLKCCPQRVRTGLQALADLWAEDDDAETGETDPFDVL